jgi:hypothetical protein
MKLYHMGDINDCQKLITCIEFQHTWDWCPTKMWPYGLTCTKWMKLCLQLNFNSHHFGYHGLDWIALNHMNDENQTYIIEIGQYGQNHKYRWNSPYVYVSMKNRINLMNWNMLSLLYKMKLVTSANLTTCMKQSMKLWH